MEIRDVLHGSIKIESHELPIIDSRYFQRLRHIKQLGFAEYSYPSATHNRYTHSLGTMKAATQAFETIFGGPERLSTQYAPDRLYLYDHAPETFRKFRALVRLGALLHDVGHGPFSHTTEFAMPEVGALKLPIPIKNPKRQATHEDYTLKIILDSSLTPHLVKGGALFGFTPLHVAGLIDPSLPVADDFFIETIQTENGPETINFRPILQQLISSELDADRMDYLRRDSYYAGVSYGQFDYDWLVGNLSSHVQKGKCYLSLQHRALYSFEDFLISRYHMFLTVYFHYKSAVYDEMLKRYFETAPGEYELPADIEKYIDATDAQLSNHLLNSKNEWAKRISDKRPFRMLIELHSGIPAGKMARDNQEKLLIKVKDDLKRKKIFFLESTATSELSKYFKKEKDPIFVRYDNHFSATSYIPLEKCTDLFERYHEQRSINRLYVSPEHYKELRLEGRKDPLIYEAQRT